MTLSLVQALAVPDAASGSFTTPTTAGNTVVVAVLDEESTNVTVTVTGVTLGGSADHFAQAKAVQSGYASDATQFAAIWVDPDCAGGQTAVAVTGTNLDGLTQGNGIVIMEIAGAVSSTSLASVLDVTATSSGTTGTTPSTGTTGTSAQADEIFIGALSGSDTLSAFTSGWTSVPVNDGGGTYNVLGYKIVTATGTAVFGATQASSGPWAGTVITLKAATAAYPALSTFTDGFPGTTLNASNWYDEPDASNGEPSGTITVDDGTLSLYGGNYSDTGYYTSLNSQDMYSLAGSSGFIRAIPNTSSSDYDTGFSLVDMTDGDGYAIGVTGGNLYVESASGSNYTQLKTVAYNATEHAWWRISESGGTITFSAAPDGLTWTSVYTTTTETLGDWSVDATDVQLYYGSSSGDAQPAGVSQFQSFNVTPSAAVTSTGTVSLNLTDAVNGAETVGTSGGAVLNLETAASGGESVTSTGAASLNLKDTVNGTEAFSSTGTVTLTLADAIGVSVFTGVGVTGGLSMDMTVSGAGKTPVVVSGGPLLDLTVAGTGTVVPPPVTSSGGAVLNATVTGTVVNVAAPVTATAVVGLSMAATGYSPDGSDVLLDAAGNPVTDGEDEQFLDATSTVGGPADETGFSILDESDEPLLDESAGAGAPVTAAGALSLTLAVSGSPDVPSFDLEDESGSPFLDEGGGTLEDETGSGTVTPPVTPPAAASLQPPVVNNWLAGSQLTADDMNSYVSDAFEYLANPPLTRVEQNTVQVIAPSTWQVLALQEVIEDTRGSWVQFAGNATIPNYFTAQVAGWYSISLIASAVVPSGTTGKIGLWYWSASAQAYTGPFEFNQITTGGGGEGTWNAYDESYFQVGDLVMPVIYVEAAADYETFLTVPCTFEIAWISS